jgi:hypothetical protein
VGRPSETTGGIEAWPVFPIARPFAARGFPASGTSVLAVWVFMDGPAALGVALLLIYGMLLFAGLLSGEPEDELDATRTFSGRAVRLPR